MDTVFLANEAERQVFLQQMMKSFRCAYICIWSYLPQPSNCLFFLDGVYRGLSTNQPSSSSGNITGRSLFEVYRGLLHDVDAGRIPGFAFKNKLTYMELTLHDVQRMAFNDLQLKFYQEAKIQNIVFMGCGAGEIEIGFSDDHQVNMEMEIMNMISSSFSHQRFNPLDPLSSSSQPTDQTQRPCSSSLSIRSLSVDSIDQYSPVLFSNINPQSSLTGQEVLIPKQALNRTEFPEREIEDAAVAKAILAVLSSSPSTNPSSSQSFLKPTYSAFTSYASRTSSLARPFHQAGSMTRSNNMFKRTVLFFRKLNIIRRQELSSVQGNQTTPTQLHHMISERRRREKLNESFQALRSLLPPGSKKDKASVLSITTEYLSTLKSQVEELIRRNQALEDRILTQSSEGYNEVLGFPLILSERTSVEISHVASTSTLPEERFLDLRVAVRGGECSMLSFVTGMLDFLRQRSDVRLSSIQSNTMMVESNPVHGIVMRLKIVGSEFEESNLEEAVKKVVDELVTR